MSHPVRFEPSDAPMAPIVTSLLWLAVFIGVVLAVCWYAANVFARREAAAQPRRPVLAFPADRKPPLPNLLTDEPKALREYLADESAVLSSYGYVDAERGIVRIPIDEAIRIVAANGLTPPAPASPSPEPSPSAEAGRQ